ncbi:BatA domain-containing protein, partial [Caenispirillum bisanense]|uniref:BatA domain-containing protein n=1 Tax=Caenispirillum bisanense TaxID=414052 RepID=UPI0031DA9E5D
MWTLGPLAFAAPWVLAALLILPALWFLLRVTPPAPRRMVFPALRLLLGLRAREDVTARTPWWLILLRLVIAALIIVGLARPLLNPLGAEPRRGPLLLVVDDDRTAAAAMAAARQAALGLIARAARAEV